MTFTGEILNGDCLRSVRAGSTLDSVSLHILMSTKMLLNENNSRIFLCENYMQGNYIFRGRPAQSATGEPTNQPLPSAAYYGSTGTEDLGTSMPNPEWSFDLAELAAWNPIVVNNPDYIGQPDNQENATYLAEGPRFKYGTCYMRLKKRDQVLNPFAGLQSARWTSNDTTLYDYDWLGNLMPGGWCMTNRNVPEPILGQTYYEDARTPTQSIPVINKGKQSIQEDFLPFCDPLNVYNNAGTRIGSFDGIAFMCFFNLAAIKNPTKRPKDRTLLPDLENQIPLLDAERQILSFEVWVYLSGIGGIKSPRVATIRFWYYTKGVSFRDTGANDSPFSPYMFFNAGKDTSIKINLNLLDNLSNVEKLKTKVLKIPLSSLHFFIGA
jgi:hypothetical protein